MMQKFPVCLIRPPAVEAFRFATTSIALPIGLAYIAGALEKSGYPTSVIDAVGIAPHCIRSHYKGYLLGLPLTEIVKRVSASTRVVGITAIFTHEWPMIVELTRLIKESRPDVWVVIGGEHVTSMPEFSLETSLADVIVLGEGEETVIELMDALHAPVPDLSGILGVAYRDGVTVRVNARRRRNLAVDDIAVPAWHHFDIAAYHRNRFSGGMYSDEVTLPILATRGCPYQCTYCSAPQMWELKWVPRDPRKVVDEIEYYVKTYGARNFPFQDLTAIIRKDWIVSFCRELLRRELKITWQLPTGTRSEAIDAEVAELLRESGMVSMAYAPESGSEATRKQIKKRMKTETLMGSVRDAVQARLNVAVFLVIGFPHDSPESVRENMPFIDHLVEAGVTDLSVGFYMALPGTELFHSLYAAGKIKVDRAYFRHILDSLALIPSQSYCDHLTPLSMTRWKLQMYWRFYRAQSSLAASILRGLLSKSGHQSKLQTALRNARVSLWKGVVSLVGGRWISRADERQMFSGWDAIYRKIEKTRQDRLAENERAGSAYSPHLKDETLVGDPTSGSSLRNAPPQF